MTQELNSDQALNETIFWLIRARVCLKLNSIEGAINRLDRALHAFDWYKIWLVYSK